MDCVLEDLRQRVEELREVVQECRGRERCDTRYLGELHVRGVFAHQRLRRLQIEHTSITLSESTEALINEALIYVLWLGSQVFAQAGLSKHACSYLLQIMPSGRLPLDCGFYASGLISFFAGQLDDALGCALECHTRRNNARAPQHLLANVKELIAGIHFISARSALEGGPCTSLGSFSPDDSFREAEKHYKAALHHNQQSEQTRTYLATLYNYLGRYDETIAMLTEPLNGRVPSQRPKSPLLFVAYVRKGKYDEALGLLPHALSDVRAHIDNLTPLLTHKKLLRECAEEGGALAHCALLMLQHYMPVTHDGRSAQQTMSEADVLTCLDILYLTKCQSMAATLRRTWQRAQADKTARQAAPDPTREEAEQLRSLAHTLDDYARTLREKGDEDEAGANELFASILLRDEEVPALYDPIDCLASRLGPERVLFELFRIELDGAPPVYFTMTVMSNGTNLRVRVVQVDKNATDLDQLAKDVNEKKGEDKQPWFWQRFGWSKAGSCNTLYRDLLDAHKEVLQGKAHVIVAPDGQLCNVPLHLLLQREDRPRPDLVTVVLCGRELLRRHPDAPQVGSPFVLAPSKCLGNVLPPGEDPSILTEPEEVAASLGCFMAEDLESMDSPVAEHISRHGSSPMDSEALPRMAGTKDGKDTISEWRVRKLDRTGTAVSMLMACQAARGHPMRMEGTFTLVRSSLCAGSRTVVAPIWSVAGASCQTFSLEFLKALKSQKSNGDYRTKGEAFQEAVQLVKTRYKDSTDWAAFLLFGDFGPLSDKERRRMFV